MSSNKSAKNKLKIAVGILKDGKVENAKTIDLKIDSYDVIPLQPDSRIYNRARIKRESERVIKNETNR